MSEQPPRMAESVLRRLVGGRDADAVAGDLREAFEARGGGRLWYWRQALSCLAVRFSLYRRMLPGIGTDFTRALRRIRRNPGYAVTAMLCLALAMGVNTTLFSFLDSMFFRKLPVPEADRVVLINGEKVGFCSWNEYLGFRDSLRSVRAAAGGFLFFDTIDFGRLSFNANIEAASANYGQVLRLGATLGTWFPPAADTPAGSAAAVISHRLWRTRFGSDPAVVGKEIRIHQQPFRIAGVAPPGFSGTLSPFATDAWVPLASISPRGSQRAMGLTARLLPGATLESVAAEVRVLAARLRAADPPDPKSADRVVVKPASGFIWGGGRRVFMPILTLMSAVCGIVLLIACVNVANLLLSRAVVRQREMAVRQSLGASRARLFRETLAEGLVLAAGGLALGILAGYWTGRAIELALPSVPLYTYQGLSLGIDWRVAALVAAACVSSAVLFSLPPALANSRRNVNPALKGEDGRRSRQREIYSLAQVALSLALLIATGLLLRALQKVQNIDPGFAADHRLYVNLWAHPRDIKPEAATQLLTSLLEQARAIPGVEDATLAWQVFPNSGAGCASKPPGVQPSTPRANNVEPNYFEMMRIPIVRGRGFPPSASFTDTPNVIVNETMARTWWPGEDAIGKTLRIGCNPSNTIKLGTVIGIARDAKYDRLDEDPIAFYYLSRREDPGNGFYSLIIRTAGDPRQWTRPLLNLVQGGGASLRVYEAQTIEDSIALSLWEIKWQAALLGALGLLAIVLAAIGLYGVVACAVSQRTREIGVRMALGAVPGDVQWMVLAHGLRITGLGILGGLLLSAATVRLLRRFLYGLSPFDPVAFAGASLAWMIIAMLASWYPARRATRVDPLTALKYE